MHRGKVDPGVSELPRGNELSRDHVNRPSQNTPEIKFECQEDEQLSNILELYFKMSKVLGKSVPRNFHSD